MWFLHYIYFLWDYVFPHIFLYYNKFCNFSTFYLCWWQIIVPNSFCFEIFYSLFLFYIISPLHCVKRVRIRSYSVSHFPAFGLNTERYSKYRKMQTRITTNTNTFYAVLFPEISSSMEKNLRGSYPDMFWKRVVLEVFLASVNRLRGTCCFSNFKIFFRLSILQSIFFSFIFICGNFCTVKSFMALKVGNAVPYSVTLSFLQ